MDTTPYIARTTSKLIRIDSPSQQQNDVPAQPPKLRAVPPADTAPPLLAMSMASSSTSSATTAPTASIGRAASEPTIKSTNSSKTEKQNSFSAAFVEFVGRILIEKMFFQNLHIPQDLLLSVVNNLIQTVAQEQKTKVDVYQEGIVLCKQLMGKELTPEEQRYDRALKEIDVSSEILNGIKYSSLALMGGSLYNSVTSAVNQGLWSHVPAIVGYGGAIVFGPKMIQGAVEKALAYSGLTSEQKKQLTPWLNSIGRLALGFMPKVNANEQGVQYRHPSMEGHTSVVTAQGTVTLAGNKITVEHQNNFQATAGGSKAYNGLQFKLHGIHEITQDKIKLYVINHAGQKVAVEFITIQSGLGQEIVVKSSDKQLEAYWNQEVRSILPLTRTNDLACQSALALGAVASTMGQNALPALIASLSCWPRVSASARIVNEEIDGMNKRAALQQLFPATFNLNNLDGINGFTVSGVVSGGQLGYSISTAGDINGDNITDLVLGADSAYSDKGVSFVIFGSKNQFPASFSLYQLNGINGFIILGVENNGKLGRSVSTAGDVNGDKITDLVLGANQAGGYGTSYVIFGSRLPFPLYFDLTQLNGTNGFTIPGGIYDGQLGYSVSTAGDINGDNITDLVLGAPRGLVGYAASHVIFGSRSPFPASFNLTQLNGTNGFTIPALQPYSMFGNSVSAAGDINGDNTADLVIGDFGANSYMGATYVIFGSRNPFPASFNLTQLNGTNGFTIPGVVSRGQLGYSVSTAGDINSDNIADIVLGANSQNFYMDATYVIFGSRIPFPASFNLTQLNGTNGLTISGIAPAGNLGVSVSTEGDINGDNIADLMLGADNANLGVGSTYVIFGSRSPFTASFNLTQINGINGFTVPGVTISGGLGYSISAAGDINGDSITDLVLGAPYANSNLGASYVIFGKNTVTRTLTPTPTPIFSLLTPCSIARPLTVQNNAIQINQAETLRVTPNDLSANCGNNTTPNLRTLFNITGINHAQFKTRNSSGIWNNVSSFLGNDLSQGNVELIQNNSTLAPQINFTVTDGQTTLPETPANIQFNISKTSPVVTAINIDIQKNGTITITPQQFQITGVGTQLDNVVISVTAIQGGYFTIKNDTTALTDFTYYQVKDKQIQFVHNGTTLPNMTLTVGDGSGVPVAFSPLVHFFNTDNPNNPAVPVEAVVGGAIGAVAVTAAVGLTALGVVKYRQHKEREEERNHQTPELKAVAHPLQIPSAN